MVRNSHTYPLSPRARGLCKRSMLANLRVSRSKSAVLPTPCGLVARFFIYCAFGIGIVDSPSSPKYCLIAMRTSVALATQILSMWLSISGGIILSIPAGSLPWDEALLQVE
jgi:hypothetical protein